MALWAGSPPLPDFGWLFPLRSLSPREHVTLQRDRAVVAILPAEDRDFAAFGVARFEQTGDQLVRWTRALPRDHTNRYITEIGRFSNPPVLSDVNALTLDDRDLDDLRRCRPGACGVQLSDAEILAIRETIERAGPEWKAEAQKAFRRFIVERARQYLQSGLAGAPPYHDHGQPVSPAAELSALLARAGLEDSGIPAAIRQVVATNGVDPSTGDSFLYWSKEVFNGAKPVVSIVHGEVIRPAASTGLEALRVETQVYASHYFSASLTLIGVTRPVGDDAVRHLVYRRHVRGDVFDGIFGGVVRTVVERRIRRDAPRAVELLRQQIAEADRGGSAAASRTAMPPGTRISYSLPVRLAVPAARSAARETGTPAKGPQAPLAHAARAPARPRRSLRRRRGYQGP